MYFDPLNPNNLQGVCTIKLRRNYLLTKFIVVNNELKKLCILVLQISRLFSVIFLIFENFFLEHYVSSKDIFVSENDGKYSLYKLYS